ncbi:TetR family transcriptional regulator C-terminal domain-containing protein [Streptomyces flavidovirens]|uniref:TetR family transcriptional regulator C-terminal domain-containing protein n=1 Tax=Streptomyces flavidovirens TaxID=67298 RepID=UPI003F53F04F
MPVPCIHAETPLFTGGCFWAANLADFDSRPGQVRDAPPRGRRVPRAQPPEDGP